MPKTVELDLKGVKCDAAGCDWRDENAKFSEAEIWLNKPCPKCGANLLTQEDLNTINFMISSANLINGMFPETDEPSKNRMFMEVKMKGDGSVNFEKKTS